VNDRGKFVRVHASAKLPGFIGHGQVNPAPAAACSLVLNAIASVKYSGSRMVKDAIASRIVRPHPRRPSPRSASGLRRRPREAAATVGASAAMAIRATLLGGG
jgi:hypothetical protein